MSESKVIKKKKSGKKESSGCYPGDRAGSRRSWGSFLLQKENSDENAGGNETGSDCPVEKRDRRGIEEIFRPWMRRSVPARMRMMKKPWKLL